MTDDDVLGMVTVGISVLVEEAEDGSGAAEEFLQLLTERIQAAAEKMRVAAGRTSP